MRRHPELTTLGIDLGTAGAVPNEFRIFVAGWNSSEKGRILFDADAAAEVMATYAKHAVDRMIDLEHLSLNEASPAYDPDARGWCKLELRNGELWAVDVRWTDDGASRLREKRQRYVSPAFLFDKTTQRVTKIVNIALTAMPATHDADELVAAKDTPIQPKRFSMLDPKQIAEALDALIAGDTEKCAELLKGIIASAAGGEAAPPEEAPADEEAAAAADAPPEPPPADPEMVAASVRLARLTGKPTITEQLEEIESWRQSHLGAADSAARLAAEQATLDAKARDAQGVELAKLNGPALAWADPLVAGDVTKRQLAEPYASMKLAALKDHVTKLKAARGAQGGSGNVRPPAAPDANGLTERELKLCKDKGIDPVKYSETRKQIRSRSQGASTA